jgi:hypothetical protein
LETRSAHPLKCMPNPIPPKAIVKEENNDERKHPLYV